MPFEHACFISYCRDEGIVMKGLMKQLEDGLNSALALYIKDKKVYTDEKLRLGDDFEKKLAEAICHSICLIVVYSPSYEESDFCLREFMAMENIEEKRMQLLGEKVTSDERMIIPIIFRGEDNLPSKIAANIHYCDCSKMSLSCFIGDISNNPTFLDEMEKIAKAIYMRYKKFEEIDTCAICKSFEFPKEKILPWRAYLFSWEKIENNNRKLMEYVTKKFNIDWIKTAEIKRIEDGRTIKVFSEKNHLLLSLNVEKNKVRLEIDDGRTDEFIAKMEKGELNIYKKPMDQFPKM